MDFWEWAFRTYLREHEYSMDWDFGKSPWTPEAEQRVNNTIEYMLKRYDKEVG